jgi:hypothetical protein
MKTALWIAVVVGALAGCGDRARLTQSHGRAYKEAFARQAMNPNAGAQAKTPKGLDSQEAAIVSDNYRRGLAAKGAKVDDEPMLLVAPGARSPANSGAYMPPPSVPQQR